MTHPWLAPSFLAVVGGFVCVLFGYWCGYKNGRQDERNTELVKRMMILDAAEDREHEREQSNVQL